MHYFLNIKAHGPMMFEDLYISPTMGPTHSNFVIWICRSPVMYVARTSCFFCCRLQIEESSKPLRFSQQLDKAVTTNYKPVANHAYNVCQAFP